MTPPMWYRRLAAMLIYGWPQPGQIGGVRLCRVIAICGVLLQIRFAAGDQVQPTGLAIPASATRLTISAQLTQDSASQLTQDSESQHS